MRLSLSVCAGLLGLAVLAPASAQQCDLSDPTLLKPDLKALPPGDVRVIERDGHRLVIFTTTIGNIGAGPLVLHGHTVQTPSGPMTQAVQEIWRTDGSSCTNLAGTFEFHASHAHWHFDDFSDYQLRKDDPLTGEIVAEASKVSFCLLDIMQLPGFNLPRLLNGSCESQDSTQGISVGFADVYDSLLPEQWIDLDSNPDQPVPAGDYFLVNVANPEQRIIEINADPAANAGFVSVSVPGLPEPLPTPTPRPPVVRPPRPTMVRPTHPSRPVHLRPTVNGQVHPQHPPGPHH